MRWKKGKEKAERKKKNETAIDKYQNFAADEISIVSIECAFKGIPGQSSQQSHGHQQTPQQK
jgi:hypothetical protein